MCTGGFIVGSSENIKNFDDFDFEYAKPNAGALMQSLRAFGYDIATAIADLIDNSITANAKNIEITFEWNKGNPWVAIADDGDGMTEAELSNAMKTGSRNPLEDRDASDLGRFGLGLKTASFSQCKRLSVASKKDGSDDISVRCWDLDLVTEKNEWILLKNVSDIAKKQIDIYFHEKTKRGSGTLVFWEKIDKLLPEEESENNDTGFNDLEKLDYETAFREAADSVKKHISMVFSGYMQGAGKVNFSLNKRGIELWDPFMKYNDITKRCPEEKLRIGEKIVKVKPYILPHQSRLSVQEFQENEGPRGWNEQQGFYIYRNNRLIVAGEWLLPGLKKLEQYRLARVRIDIGNDMDTLWNIDVRKSTAIPPLAIQEELQRIAKTAQRDSSKVYRQRATRTHKGVKKEPVFVWNQMVRHGKCGYAINREHPLIKELLKSSMKKEFRQLLEIIEETVPVPTIIQDYNEKAEIMLKPFEGKAIEGYDEKIQMLYELYLSHGCTKKEAIANILNTEPYMYKTEIVQVFCDKEGIDCGE